MPKKPFKGVLKLDVRDSVPDWTPYTPTKAPEGAPTILFELYDDTGKNWRFKQCLALIEQNDAWPTGRS